MNLRPAALRVFFSASLVFLVFNVVSAGGLSETNKARELDKRANKLEYAGKYAEALLIEQEALELLEKAWSANHPRVSVAVYNLARLYAKMGDDEKAESLYQRALAIREKADGSTSLSGANILNDLGEMFLRRGDHAKAEPLFLQVLPIREKEFQDSYLQQGQTGASGFEIAPGQWIEPSDARDRIIGNTLNSLGLLYYATGNYLKAETFFQQALAIREKAFGVNDPNVASTLSSMVRLYHAKGNYDQAKLLCIRALRIRETALGPQHPDVAVSLNSLGGLEVARQNYQSAVGSLKKGLAIQERQIRNVFAITTEEQKLAYIQSVSGAYHGFLSLIHQHFSEDREVVRDGLELVLRRKGAVLDAQSRTREALQGRLSEVARKEWDTLSSLKSELARLLLNKPPNMGADAYREKLASLQRQIEDTERRLAGQSALVAKELNQRTITVEAVANGLPRNSALVEFVKIQDFDFVKGKWKPSFRYLALVLTKAGNVTFVDLGEASKLENQAQSSLRDIEVSLESPSLQMLNKPDRANPNQQSVLSLKELYTQVWAPLQKALGSADKVVVSPDGLLNLVPFAALMDGEGRALVENYRLAYVSSGRELVIVEGAAAKPESDLLLVANPAFDGIVHEASRPETAVRSGDFRGVFSPLPGTEREAKEIPPLVTGQGGQKRVLDGINATEHVVKTTRSPRILHLATHGFFLQDEEITPSDETQGLTAVPKEKPAPVRRYENPLARSGLAFAGANKASEVTEGDDGILTALEITGMDLYGTELVVLSACDTGVGEVKSGEGVFGLRRAFALAGAKNLMMSLWPVSDEVTANQMKAFYRNLQTLPPAEALRQAQLETIKELKAKYEGIAPPGLWAPFILQGAQALGQ